MFARPRRVRVKSREDADRSLQTAQSWNPSLDYKVDSHQIILCHELHVEVSMCAPLRLIIIPGTVLLGAVEIGSAATTRAHRPARVPSAAPVQGNWCLYYHAGGANCRFGDFQGCMYAAAAAGCHRWNVAIRRHSRLLCQHRRLEMLLSFSAGRMAAMLGDGCYLGSP
jgi:hypothetical protein